MNQLFRIKSFKVLRFAAIIIVMLIMTSCGNKRDKKVGLLLHEMEGRWIKEVEYLKKFAADEGLELIVKVADGNEKVQIDQVDELLNEGVGVILVVAVNQNTAAGIVRKAEAESVPVIAYDRIIRNADLSYLITYDYAEVGALMAQYATQKIPKGNYVMFWGDASDANAQAMHLKQEEILKPFVDRGDIHVVYKTYIEGWSDIYAKNQMDNILSFSKESIDVVLASNDVIAQAVLEVIEKHGSNAKVLVTGQDATLEACRSIVAGKQTMTVYKSTVNMAREAMALSAKILKRSKIEQPKSLISNGRIDVPTFLLQPAVTDATNMMSTVVADGVFTKDEVYGVK